LRSVEEWSKESIETSIPVASAEALETRNLLFATASVERMTARERKIVIFLVMHG
jgi:hypothetical protein